MTPPSMNMETFLGWFGYVRKEKTHFMVFSMFAITPIHNHGFSYMYGFYKTIDIVFLFTD